MRPSLCGCLVDVPLPDLSRILGQRGFELFEWRLDSTLAIHGEEETLRALAILGQTARQPVLATNRPVREGGLFSGTEEVRISILEAAVKAGAEWVDLEWDVSAQTLARFHALNVRRLLSHHEFESTPDSGALKKLVERMARQEVECLKIVTHARSQEDNLRVLELIPWARHQYNLPLIAFCMGPLGRWSRLVCLLLGSPWTYVQLGGMSPGAPGQLTAEDMNRLWELLSHHPL